MNIIKKHCPNCGRELKGHECTCGTIVLDQKSLSVVSIGGMIWCVIYIIAMIALTYALFAISDIPIEAKICSALAICLVIVAIIYALYCSCQVLKAQAVTYDVIKIESYGEKEHARYKVFLFDPDPITPAVCVLTLDNIYCVDVKNEGDEHKYVITMKRYEDFVKLLPVPSEHQYDKFDNYYY